MRPILLLCIRVGGKHGFHHFYLPLPHPSPPPSILITASSAESNGVSPSSVPNSLLQALGKTMNHSSNEIKTLTTSVFYFLAKNSTHPLDLAFIKPVMASLINGTKEKNSAVRASSEQALVAVLRLRQGQVIIWGRGFTDAVALKQSGEREPMSVLVFL